MLDSRPGTETVAMRRIMAVGVAALMGAILAMVNPVAAVAAEGPVKLVKPHATAAAAADPWGYFINFNSAMYLSTEAGRSTNGAKALQWRWAGSNDQVWQPVPVGDTGYFILRNATSWRVLGVAGRSTANSARAVLWDEEGANVWNQHWGFLVVSGGFLIVNRASLKCLGVAGGSVNQGAAVVQYECDGSANQVWRFLAKA